jgi:hypothetical protein
VFTTSLDASNTSERIGLVHKVSLDRQEGKRRVKRRVLIAGALVIALSLSLAAPAFAATIRGGIASVKRVSGGYRFTLKSGSVPRYFYSYAPNSKFICRAEGDAVTGSAYSHHYVSSATMAADVKSNLGFGYGTTKATFSFRTDA